MKEKNVKRAINWLYDLHNDEMIEAKDYTKMYLGYDEISQDELNDICTLLNIILVLAFHNLEIIRIDNSMGEIIPIRRR